MGTSVVCMVRGGEAGRKVQEMAIAYAMEENLNLVFLHIIDPLGCTARDEISSKAWLEEMTWLGQVTLGLAQQRAKERGVHCILAIQTGAFFPTTVQFLSENNVARLFIGSPHNGVPDFEHRLAGIQKFADQILTATGVSVIIANSE